MDFKEILKELLQGTSQSALAEKIGVKQSQISEWLKGKAKPGYDTLKQICIGLSVSPAYLLGLEDETGSPVDNGI